MKIEQIQENPRLIVEPFSYGCCFAEEDKEGVILYEGEIWHELDSNEIITARAEVY